MSPQASRLCPYIGLCLDMRKYKHNQQFPWNIKPEYNELNEMFYVFCTYFQISELEFHQPANISDIQVPEDENNSKL